MRRSINISDILRYQYFVKNKSCNARERTSLMISAELNNSLCKLIMSINRDKGHSDIYSQVNNRFETKKACV